MGKKKVIPFEEVQKHNGIGESHWTVINEEVYDISDFIQQHPGGIIIRIASGRDATTLFESYHPGTSMPKIMATLKSKAKHLGRCEDLPPKGDDAFFVTVRERVEKFLSENGIKRQYSEVISIGEWLGLIAAYAVLYYYGVIYQNYFAAALLGLVVARFGFLMHMGLHAGFSRSPLMNRLCGYSMDFIGSNSTVWTYEHQVAHHMDPNELGKDNDYSIGDPILRFNKDVGFNSLLHRWNHYLTMLVMPLGPWRWYVSDLFIVWSGVVGSVNFHTDMAEMLQVAFWKAFWGLRMVVLPCYWYGWSGIIPAVITNTLMAYYLQNIFIVNHIQSGLEPPKGSHWSVRQIFATSNWSSGSFFWNWVAGGLNHQIEHHLFPSVSYWVYPMIMPIVRDTCREFGLPYFNFSNYRDAWVGMFRHLETLAYEENDPKRPSPKMPEDLARSQRKVANKAVNKNE